MLVEFLGSLSLGCFKLIPVVHNHTTEGHGVRTQLVTLGLLMSSCVSSQLLTNKTGKKTHCWSCDSCIIICVVLKPPCTNRAWSCAIIICMGQHRLASSAKLVEWSDPKQPVLEHSGVSSWQEEDRLSSEGSKKKRAEILVNPLQNYGTVTGRFLNFQFHLLLRTWNVSLGSN